MSKLSHSNPALDDGPVPVCERCNGTGLIGRRNVYPLAYVGPGPVPEDARGVFEAECDYCETVA